jgi:RNA polymerase II subunit A small phosphatase-like protein
MSKVTKFDNIFKYANPLMDIIDPNKCCTFRLYREHCINTNGVFIKDLTRIGRNMKDIIIVDVREFFN